MTGLPDPISIVFVLILVSALPFVIVMMTAYTKVVVVLLLLRNALGLQQVPPNLVIYAVTLVLTAFISQPVFSEVANSVMEPGRSFETVDDWLALLHSAAEPMREYLLRFANEREQAFFLEAAQRLWTADMAASVRSTDLVILIPSFVVTELSRAFEIGFLLYLPFVVIDLVVSNILIALGAMMVSPVTISLPIKLFLFVLVDGWARLLHALVLSYV